MRKSDDLEILCTKLSRKLPDWQRIISQFSSHPEFDSGKELSLDQYVNSFRQIHLDLSLQQIAQAEPGMNIDVRPRLKYGNRSRDYRFRFNASGTLSTFSKGYNGTYPLHTYDKLIGLDGEPVIFDIKLSPWKLTRPKVRERNTGKTSKTVGLNWFLRKEMYDKKLKPLRDYFNHDVGYVVVVANDEFNRCTSSDVFRDFYEDGGLVVPFYAGRQEFRDEVSRQVRSLGLKLKGEEYRDRKRDAVSVESK